MPIAIVSGDTLFDEQMVYTRGYFKSDYLDSLLQVDQEVQSHSDLGFLKQVHEVERSLRQLVRS